MDREQAKPLSDALALFVRYNGLGPGLVCQAVFEAWDAVSMAGAYTTNRFFRDGTLHVTVSSSVLRSTLLGRRDAILAGMNETLSANELLRGCGLSVKVEKISMR